MVDQMKLCLSLLIATAIVLAPLMAKTARAQEIASVNGEPITEADVEQRSRLTQVDTHKTPTREEVIDQLRNEKLKVHEARKVGLEVLNSEVDDVLAKYANRMGMTTEQLTQSFVRSGVTVDTVKHRIRSDIAWERYTRKTGNSRPR